MEKIGLHNYEAWFLDYSENSLTESQVVALNIFLQEYPELKQELIEFKSTSLPAINKQAIDESFKANLRREETTGLTRAEYLMIAEVEGNISKKEKAELAAIVAKEPIAIKELGLYHKTKLSDKELFIFEEKSGLIQKEPRVIAWWTYASTVAAAAVIAFVMWNTNTFNQSYTPRNFAWELGQDKQEESLSNAIVNAGSLKVEEVIKSFPSKNKNNQFAQEKVRKAAAVNSKNEKRDALGAVELLDQELAAKQPQKLDTKVQEGTPKTIIATIQSAKNSEANLDPVEARQEFVSIQQFAKEKIKEDILKGKTFSESFVEEIAEISNDRITFEVDKEKGSLFESFALNIGKLSISRNR